MEQVVITGVGLKPDAFRRCAKHGHMQGMRLGGASKTVSVQVQQLQPLDKCADEKLAESVLAVSKKWANDLLGTSRGEENDSDHNKDDTEEDEPNCEHCVTCYKRGLLHLCDSCPAAYHAECVESSVIEENDDLVCSMLGLSCCKVSASTLDKRAKRKLLELQKKQQGKKGK